MAAPECQQRRARTLLATPRPRLDGGTTRDTAARAPRLRTLGDHLQFALLYAAIVLVLLVTGLAVAQDRSGIVWITAASALLPFTFLPGWWAEFRGAELAARSDVPTRTERVCHALITLVAVSVLLGGGLLAALLYLV